MVQKYTYALVENEKVYGFAYTNKKSANNVAHHFRQYGAKIKVVRLPYSKNQSQAQKNYNKLSKM